MIANFQKGLQRTENVSNDTRTRIDLSLIAYLHLIGLQSEWVAHCQKISGKWLLQKQIREKICL